MVGPGKDTTGQKADDGKQNREKTDVVRELQQGEKKLGGERVTCRD